jgi:filamentous hemagglutinin
MFRFNLFVPIDSAGCGTGTRHRDARLVLICGFVLALGASAHAGNSLRAGAMSGAHNSSSSSAATSQTATAATTATSQTAQTSVLAQHAQASLTRSLQALQASQAAQAAARNAALNGASNLGLDPAHPGQTLPNVPDGLGVGGLNPIGGAISVIAPKTASLTTSGTQLSTTGYQVPASWVNVGALSQSTDSGSGKVIDTVTQDAQQALLYWSSFNIGRHTTLSFDQSRGGANVGQWVAINQITDPSLSPSQILGSIQAPGQVYVINQNGIIFGGGAQVNVGALTASSLALNPDYIANGLLNNAGNNFEFQFSSLFTTTTAQTGPRGHKVLSTTVAPLWTSAPVVPDGGTQTISSVPTGDVTVQAGAQLTSPTNAENQGGRIALIAPNVTNHGTISTPDGQTILAAGLQVGFAAHDANDASLRGLDVYVGQVSADASTLPAGTFTFNGLPNNAPVTFAGSGEVGTYTLPGSTTPVSITGNTPTSIPIGSTVTITAGTASYSAAQAGIATNAGNGDIEAPRADVTITGQTVNQMGIINGSTSVTLNGRIDLLADYSAAAETINGVTTLDPFSTGSVNLGGQSVTQILPEISSTETTIGTQLAFSSLVNIQGQNIEMFPGSLLYAPSAAAPSSTTGSALDLAGLKLTSGVTMNAGSWFAVGSDPGQTQTVFSNDSGQIALDNGSSIDVSGSENVSASVAEDVIPVQLRGPELADSSLQRNGTLRGTTVYIDIRNVGVYNGQAWVGTPLGDVSGYVNDIGRTVGELTSSGGTVALNAGSSVGIQSGASINVSGGWINYAGATVANTKVSANGQILDISQATPNLVYEGIYNGFTAISPKWGLSQTFTNGLLSGSQYDAGFVQGGNGGAISITAPSMTLSGNFYGNTVAGSQQRTPRSTLNATYAGATFLPTTLDVCAAPAASQLTISFLQATADRVANVYGVSSPDVQFQTDSYIAQNAPLANQVLLSQDITNTNGFGVLSIDTSAGGTVSVPGNISLATVPGGQITFLAANIDIEGSVSAPDGALNFKVLDVSPATNGAGLTNTPPTDFSRGNFTLDADASLSTAGLIVDDRATASTPGRLPFATSGGAISIAGINVDLTPGSTINVSGGVAVNASGQIAYGNAGSISILGGEDPVVGSLVVGGRLVLGSTLTGYSGNVNGAGSLTVQAPLVQIGGATLLNGDSSASAMTPGETSVTGNGTTLWLDRAGSPGDFFSQGGFGNFNIEGIGQVETAADGAYLFNAAGDPVISPAVLVASGTALRPIIQNFAANLSGNSIALTPLTSAQAAGELPSQRSAVNLTLNAEGVNSGFINDGPPTPDGGTLVNSNGGGGVVVRGDLVLQAHTSIQTDPQTNSSHGVSLLAARGTIAVLGTVVASGGTINIHGGDTKSLSSNGLLFYESSPNQPFATVVLGANSVLSTAGTVERSVSTLGFDTGTVLPGGNIVLAGNIVGEPGAILNVSGGTANLDETSFSLGTTLRTLGSLTPVSTRVDSNGGSITLNASQLLYDDATMLGGAGGPSAQGGSLSVSSGFAVSSSPDLVPPGTQDITLIVTQQGINGGFSIPTDALPGAAVLGQSTASGPTSVGASVNNAVGGEPVYSYFAANPNLFLSTPSNTALSNNGGRAGGFASLNLAGTVDFIGPVSIRTRDSLSVGLSSGNINTGETGGVIYANASVVLSSAYVGLNTYASSYTPDPISNYAVATAGAGSLVVNAGTLADVGNISLQNIGTLTFNSNPAFGGDIRGVGTLQVAGQINLNAAQIYPPTESTFTIMGDGVTITSPTSEPLPSLPLSAGGTLNIEAATIVQGGVLRAPFGTINLGTSTTQNITLSAGSITSISAVDPRTGKGITIPYGIVDASGNWFDPQGNNITLTGPPAKAVHVAGQDIQIGAGSTIDVAGGGDLYAYSFVSGTGGNQDILASLGTTESSTSFAILPGYSLNYAPEATYGISNNLETNGTVDAGYFNSKLAVGEQIYLKASNGLTAGYYTLLPARYAALPGAFLVTPGSGSAPGTSVAQLDGSSLVSGFVTTGLNSNASLVYSPFDLFSQAEILQEAPYAARLANTFFRASAANNNLSVPRLPVDSGQLVLNASQTMSVAGTLLSQPGAGGLGGEVDIASPEDIYIVGPGESGDVPAGALVLDSSQLTDFGAASLLIGGFRTTTSAGTAVTVMTNNLVVDNAGASTVLHGVTVDGLAAPDITLVSNSTLDVAAGAEIEQLGQLSGKAPTLTLQGDGTLLRISSDSSALTIRQNVTTPDETSLLSIGQGAKILNANGGAVGSLTLDSTASISIDNSTGTAPVLKSNALTLDSGFINLELSAPATAPTSGLIVSASQLQSLLSSTQSLSLLSYSSIALYGSGTIGGVTVDAAGNKTYQEKSIALHADDIYYADTQDSAGIMINAQTVSLDNVAAGTALPLGTGLGDSTLTINARTITLGSNAVRMDQFSTVALNADGAILIRGLGQQIAGTDAAPTPASLTTSGDLILTTPMITGAPTADQTVSANTTTGLDETIAAAGNLVIQSPVNDAVPAVKANGIAASLTLIGNSITQDGGSIVLPSGSIDLQATGGNILVNGTLDAGGVARTVYNLTKYTDGGQIALTSSTGNVAIGSTGLVNVSAALGAGTADSVAGNAGTVTITAAGTYAAGQIEGEAGTVTQAGTVIAQGNGGTFLLDVGSLDATGGGNGLVSSAESGLAGFAQQSIGDRNDGTVTIDDTVVAGSFALSADHGSIDVTGTIDASHLQTGGTGGSIQLAAGGSVTLESGAVLTVAASQLNDAGQGGAITLQAGAYEGTSAATSTAGIDLMSGSRIDLSVAGGNGGTLELRAPQVAGGAYAAGSTYTSVSVNAANGGSPTDVAIAPIANGVILNASSIAVEGFYVQDAQQASALIDTYEATAENNATAFMGNATGIQSRMFGSSTAPIHIRPGEEIDNSVGSLELQSTWDFSSLRYGAPLIDGQGNPVTNAAGTALLSEPGVLTIRAAGNLNIDFGASLTDGFDGSLGVSYLNALLPAGSQSWSYHLVAGADFTAADAGQVQTPAALLSNGLGGTVQVGYQNSGAPIELSNFTTNSAGQFFQTIRTGTGDITINSGGDVLLLNNLATIYTAGAQVDPTLGGTFVVPAGTDVNRSPIPATYSTGSGNVTIAAQGSIAHETYSPDGSALIADSSAELPTNWLDREGIVSGGQVLTPTTWWVDFTNYFEGVGALGGGNVTLTAGGSIINLDADVPTNARLVNGQLTELGGGDLVVRAGGNIDGGVYYVERGQGTLAAGNDILTNATRAAVALGQPSTQLDWLPTSLFLGKGSFSVTAGGNLLLGSTANPFLLPQSYNNIASVTDTTSELSYFSTYAATDAVNVSSLAGSLTLAASPDSGGEGSLYAWYTNVLDANATSPIVGTQLSAAQPWLLLAEATNPQQVISEFGAAGVLPTGAPQNVFGGFTALLPPTLRATAFGGDINLVGSLTLSPSADGTLDLVATGSINAFQVNQVTTAGVTTSLYGSGLVNLSDADPNALPTPANPLSSGLALSNLDALFADTGASEGLTLQTKQRLHATIDGGSLHADDSAPVYIYAGAGDISGLTLFSAKQAQVIAGQDITDVGLYIQNNGANDISMVDAGRDIIAYDAASSLRIPAGTNVLGYNAQEDPLGSGPGAPNSGDIQISGPGTLEVLTGRNLVLGDDGGQTPNKPVDGDGLYTGLTSVGGQLNPSLPFGGANIIAAAGLGANLTTVGLEGSSLTFSSFIEQFLAPTSSYASTYLPDLGSLMNLGDTNNEQVWSEFQNLPVANRDTLALDIFYLVLRDAGRDHNNSTGPGAGNYDAANLAISALFPTSSAYKGEINLTSREVKTSNGGDINLLAPGGGLTVGIEQPSGQAVDQGILTVDGGNISIFANNDVTVGTSRIFTLHGGNEIIWSTQGNIAAGASSKTVVSAPPTRVVIDPTSGAVQTDLAGLATGGGIGVLASVVGAPPGDVDLIAPLGTIDAGDAGIRASGNLNISALKVLNSDNIQVGGKSSGVPTGASVNLGALAAASSAAGSSEAAASNNTPSRQNAGDNNGQDITSVISVEVLGYGGGDSD